MTVFYNFLYQILKKINLPILLLILVGAVAFIFIIIRLRRLINPLKKAKSLYERKNNLKALVFTDYYLEKNPLSKEALFLKANIELELGLYRDAERDYYSLLYKKVKGDGIDTFKIKEKLLKALYEQDKIYETYLLSKEILSIEKENAEGLYFLALIYLGQLYFHEADKILRRLILNRPMYSQAYFAKSINDAQMRRYEDALVSINRAIELEDRDLYHLIRASLYYFNEDYNKAYEEISKLKNIRSHYESGNQYLFYLRLYSMINYKLRFYDRAVLTFKRAMDFVEKTKKEIKGEKDSNDKGYSVYGEDGRVKKQSKKVVNPVADYERKMGIKKKLSPVLEEYLRLKEVAIEEGKVDYIVKRNINDPFSLLDIDGLTKRTWIHIGYLFSLIKAGVLDKAKDFAIRFRVEHPEIIGLRRVIDLIDEKIEDEKIGRLTIDYLREKTKKLADKKKKRYELWEYIEEWEKRVLRPFELLDVAGFSTRKQLNPVILFKKDTKFALDF